MKEIYKTIPEYENYQISNKGNVKRTYKNGNEKILKQIIDTHGYKHINISKHSKTKTIKIHKLIAITWLNHKPNGHKKVIDHIDGNKLNNELENLQILTNRENIIKGERCKNNKVKSIGVNKCYKGYQAKISIKGKQIHLGTYMHESQAAWVYNNALNKLKWKQS